jgi:hypothetical protein
MRKLRLGLAAAVLALAVGVPALADTVKTITFTTGQVKSIMNGYGARLNDATYQWGLNGIRAMPIVGGSGAYTILSGSTTQEGWVVDAPLYFDWSDPTPYGFPAQNSPYGAFKYAMFSDLPGAEIDGQPATPLYMILDRPANTFNSMTFSAGNYPYNFLGYTPPVEYKVPGYDNGAGGTNLVTAVDDSTVFSFSFQYNEQNATWDGSWRFVVDGLKYHRFGNGGVSVDPYYPNGWAAGDPTWNNNFFGSFEWLPYYELGGSLLGNVEGGYVVSVATTKDKCKNGGWRSLVRANQSSFKNQGDCIQYVNTGK